MECQTERGQRAMNSYLKYGHVRMPACVLFSMQCRFKNLACAPSCVQTQELACIFRANVEVQYSLTW